MKLAASNLADMMLAKDLGPRVEEIITEARADASMDEGRRMASLVYSGVVLGAEEVQRHFEETANEQVMMVRGVLKEIDDTIADLSDLDTMERLKKLRAKFQDALTQRSRTLLGMHADSAERELGIPRRLILANEEPDTMDREELALAGACAYARAPGLFASWDKVTTDGTYAKMECKCISCVWKAQAMVDPLATLEKAAKRAGGLSALFAIYGMWLLDQIRDAVARSIEGAEAPHEQMSNAKEITSQVLDAMFGRKGEN